MTYAGTDALDATGIQFEDNNEGIAHTPHTSITAGDAIDSLLAGYEATHGEVLESEASWRSTSIDVPRHPGHARLWM